MTMRVGFVYQFDDQSWLGGKNYFSSLFRAIHAVAPGSVQLVLLTGHGTKTSLPQDFPFVEVVRTRLLDRWSPPWVLRQAARKLSPRRFDALFGALLHRLRIDVLSHSEPLLARGSRVKTLGWLPDFQFMHLPEYWSAEKTRYTQRAYNAVCEHSDAIVVSSAAALQDLTTFAPWYRGARHVLHFVPSAVDIERLRSHGEICGAYGLPADYFHLPNQFWRHKNHRLVIDALQLLKSRGATPTIVCTGHTADIHSDTHFDDLMRHCKAAGVEQAFRVLGVVPYADMQSLMLHARAVINPSRFEGWSTTVEEAKLMGKHLLLSSIPVHLEQAPPSADYFAVDDAAALAAAIERACRTGYPAPVQTEITAKYEQAQRVFGTRYADILGAVMRQTGA